MADNAAQPRMRRPPANRSYERQRGSGQPQDRTWCIQRSPIGPQARNIAMMLALRLCPVFLPLVLVACNGPFAVLPGGVLDGPVKPTPPNFDFARDAGTVQLESRPDDPYSVNINCAVVGDALYVSAGDNRAQWVKNMDEDPLVRLRIDGDIYELRAQRVTDTGEMDRFAREWLKNS